MKKRWLAAVLVIVCIVIHFKGVMPGIFGLKAAVHYMPFFLAGMCLNEFYPRIKDWSLKYWWLVYIIFILLNCVFVLQLNELPFVFRFILPFTGTLAVVTMAFQMEKAIENSKIVKYVEYLGKYSLQFYLFTFCYPIIRTVIVSVLHVSNPFVILSSVFVLQLICTTVIVEITRRIKWLKIPMGY